MPTFKEQIDALKSSLKKGITKDTPVETINEIEANIKQVDAIAETHSKLEKDHSDLKDKYIQNVVNYGTTEEPKSDTPRSLEDIAKAVAERDTKK